MKCAICRHDTATKKNQELGQLAGFCLWFHLPRCHMGYLCFSRCKPRVMKFVGTGRGGASRESPGRRGLEGPARPGVRWGGGWLGPPKMAPWFFLLVSQGAPSLQKETLLWWGCFTTRFATCCCGCLEGSGGGFGQVRDWTSLPKNTSRPENAIICCSFRAAINDKQEPGKRACLSNHKPPGPPNRKYLKIWIPPKCR